MEIPLVSRPREGQAGRHVLGPWMRPCCLAAVLAFGCSTMTPEQETRQAAVWEAATECSAGLNLIVDRVDSFGRVWYSLPQGGQQDVPKFNACFQAKAREKLGGAGLGAPKK